MTSPTKLAKEILEYKTRYLKRWVDAELDVLIMPAQSFVGMRTKAWVRNDQYVGYTSHWNLVDYASLTIPVAKVTAEMDQRTETYDAHIPRNKSDAYHQRLCTSVTQCHGSPSLQH